MANSLRSSVLAVIGETIKKERAVAAEKAIKRAEGKPVVGERAPKTAKSESKNFMNIRHLGEYLMLAFAEKNGENVTVITPGAFAQAIALEFPASQAGSTAAQSGKDKGHYPYYRRYILVDDVKFEDKLREQLSADGLDYTEQLQLAKKGLSDTIERSKVREPKSAA